MITCGLNGYYDFYYRLIISHEELVYWHGYGKWSWSAISLEKILIKYLYKTNKYYTRYFHKLKVC